MAVGSQLSLLSSRPLPGGLAAQSRGWLMGVHMGGMDSGVTSKATAPTQAQTNINRVTAMESWQGWRFGAYMDFNGAALWADIEGYDQRYTAIASFAAAGYVPIITIPMLPTTTDVTKADAFTDLATGAAGGYAAHWRAVADRLVNNGLGNTRIIIRLGWEFNGNTPFCPTKNYRELTDTGNVMGGGTAKTYPSNPRYKAGDKWGAVQDWQAYWRSIVDTVRSRLTARGVNPWAVEWAMCPIVGHISSLDYSSWACWPGSQWVDYVGGDIYDTVVGGPYYVSGAVVTGATMDAARASSWQAKKSGPFGLDWLAGFARTHGVKLLIGETSVSNQVEGVTAGAGTPTGGQDNATWFPNMAAWAWANADVMGALVLYNLLVNRAGEVNADFRVWDSGNPSVPNPALPLAGASWKATRFPSHYGGVVRPGRALPTTTATAPGSYTPPTVTVATYPATYPATY